MQATRRNLRVFVTSVAIVSSVSFSTVIKAQTEEETPVRTQVSVGDADQKAASNVQLALFHVMPAHVEGAPQRAAILHLENAKRAASAGVDLTTSLTGNAIASPYFYPADLKRGTGPTLPRTTHHALYVNLSGTVAANWGNPEQFLKDLNVSSFVHLLDQYAGTTAAGRYPVGGNAAVRYSYSGNVVYEHDVWAIVHAAAKKFGGGAGHLYHVFLRKGVDTCFDSSPSCYSPDNTANWAFCAYHGSASFADVGTVLFTVEPYQNVAGCAVATPSPNGQLADSTNSTLSHEVFEAITDPVGGSGFVNRISLDLGGYEIGDECQVLGNSAGDALVPTFLINGKKYEVQLEYSNTYHACASQP